MTTILHLHIPRALGSSLHQTLYPYGGGDHTLAVHRREKMAKAMADGARPKLVTGHFSFGLHEYLDGPHVYFIPFRDPVERVWSLLRFMAANPQHPKHAFAKTVETPCDLYESDERGTQFDNAMTRQMAGIESPRPLTDADLQNALENVSHPDVIAFPQDDVGIHLRELSARTGHTFGEIGHINSAPTRSLTPEWRDAILSHNQMDGALFDALRRA